MTVEDLVLSLLSGVVGALLATAVNLVVQDKRMKREVLRDYFRRYRYIRAGKGELENNMELLNEVFVAFSGSWLVRRYLWKLRDRDPFYTVARRKLLKAMCRSAWMWHSKFLEGNDLQILSNKDKGR